LRRSTSSERNDAVLGRPWGRAAFFSSLNNPGADPLAEDLAFELREDGHHASLRAPCRRGQVQRLGQRDKADSKVGQFAERHHQIGKRAAPTAHTPDHDHRKKRREFRKEIAPIESKRLVFVDETGVTTAMTPRDGRAPSGERVEASAPASWESVTVIAAMGLDGVRAPLMLPGSVNAATFESYVEQVLVPALRPGDVVVFDNLSSHLGPAVFEAIEHAGAKVLPLPPYSPDYTPIEEMFSKFKGFLRRIGARAKEHLYDAIAEGLREVTDQGNGSRRGVAWR
jgi:transposase